MMMKRINESIDENMPLEVIDLETPIDTASLI